MTTGFNLDRCRTTAGNGKKQSLTLPSSKCVRRSVVNTKDAAIKVLRSQIMAETQTHIARQSRL